MNTATVRRCERCGAENALGTRFCGHCGAPAEPAPRDAELVEERRLVTALFADLSGFSPLADRLDPEQLVEVVDPLLAAMTAIVIRYEGRVEKFAGDAVLALFGAPTSHGDDPHRALLAALDMHREIPSVAIDLPPDIGRLSVHIGINTGHGVARMLGVAVPSDYAVMGDAVVVAQRLQSSAPSGQTYVGETTYRLTSDAFDFESLGPLTLKGRRLPLRAWRLLDVRAPSKRPPSPPAPLLGRERETAVLATSLERVRAGRSAVNVVLGEAGVGKTRLSEEVRRRAIDLGIRWLEARCPSYGATVPYAPYVELLQQLLGLSPTDGPERRNEMLAQFSGQGEGDRPFLSRLFGLPSPETAGLEPQAVQHGLFRAVASVLHTAAAEQPTAIAVEDAHWMDTSSQALTAEVVRSCRDAPLLVYLTGRPEARPALESMAAGSEAGAHALLELAALPPQSVVSLIRSLAGDGVPVAFQSAVVERSGGNPFFVRELLRWSSTTEAEDAGRGALVESLPPTIEGVLSARIDRLSGPAAALLQVASVIGQRLRAELLRAVAAEGTDVETVVRELVGAGFFETDPVDPALIVFHHVLMQEVAYGRLLRRTRRRLHLRVAAAAEGLYGDGDDVIGTLARHLYLGDGGEKAVAYLARAAEVARRLFANDEAIVHLRRAVELAESGAAPTRLVELLLSLADLLELRGTYEEAQEIYERVRDAGGDPRAWLGLASTLRQRGRYADALEVLDGAAAAVPSGAALGAVHLERGRTLLVAGRPSEAISALEAAVERLGPGREAGPALLHLARAELQCGSLDDSLEHGHDALRLLEASSDLRGLVTAKRVLGGVYRHLGRLDDAAAMLSGGVELAERLGSVEELGGCLINLGMVRLQAGALDDAIACDRRAIEEFERVGHGLGRANGYANLAEKLALAGRFEEAGGYCERAIALAGELDDDLTLADATQTEAAILLGLGAPERAGAKAEEAAKLFVKLDAGPAAATAFELAARAWDEAGNAAQAREAWAASFGRAGGPT